MNRTLTLALAGMASTVMVASAAQFATAANSNSYRVRAELSGPTLASGKADYRERQRGNVLEQRFSVEVEDFAPDTELAVHVNGMLFGTIITDAFGGGELQFRTAQFIDDPGDGSPIPTDFPRINAGDAITVGPISGSFD